MDGFKALPSAQREIELAARLAVSRDSLVAFRSALLASPGDIGHILVSCGTVLVACVAVALGVCARKDV